MRHDYIVHTADSAATKDVQATLPGGREVTAQVPVLIVEGVHPEGADKRGHTFTLEPESDEEFAELKAKFTPGRKFTIDIHPGEMATVEEAAKAGLVMPSAAEPGQDPEAA
jgi:hypothetical protein